MYSRIAILVLSVCLATAGPIEDYRRLAQAKAFLTYLHNSEDAPSQNEKRWGNMGNQILGGLDNIGGDIQDTAEGLYGAAAGLVDQFGDMAGNIRLRSQNDKRWFFETLNDAIEEGLDNIGLGGVVDAADKIRDDAANLLGGGMHDALLGVADVAEGAGGVVSDLIDHLGLSSKTGNGANILGLLVKDSIIQTALVKCQLVDFISSVTDREIQQDNTLEERDLILMSMAGLITALGGGGFVGLGTAVGLGVAAEGAGLAVGTTVAVMVAYEAAKLAKNASIVACDELRDTLTEIAEENNKITKRELLQEI